MKYLYTLLTLLFIIPAFAQTKTAYLTADNKFTSSKDSASLYLVTGKMNKDSLYSMTQYTIGDSVMLTGTFRDSTLTIPQGKFLYYYTPAEIQTWKRSHIIGIDTNKYVKTAGSYMNGKKNGIWNTYDYNGDLQNSVTYKDDVLSGPFKFIDNGPTGISAHTYDGMYADGKKEGTSTVTSIYGRLEETRYFHDDQLAKTVINRKGAKGIIQPAPPANFKIYLNKQMAAYAKAGAGKKAIIKFRVDKNGRIINPVIVQGYEDAAMNQALIVLVKNSGKWKAGSIDGKRTDMVTFCTLSLTKSAFNYSVPRY